jgi:hypothetical protein
MAIPLLVVPILVLLAGSALVVQHFVQPRLPVYTLTLTPWLWPFGMRQSAVTGQWVTSISTNVQLFNANFLHLDVYAVSFDLYGERIQKSDNDPNHGMEPIVVLQHIGNLQDEQQHIATAPIVVVSTNKDSPRSGNGGGSPIHSTMVDAATEVLLSLEQSSLPNTLQQQPLWSIAPRSNFSSTTNLYMSMPSSSSSSSSSSGTANNTAALVNMLRVLRRLVWRWWHGRGRLTVVTTGVAHLKASTTRISTTTTTSSSSSSVVTQPSAMSSWLWGTLSSKGPLLLQAPLTVSIVCDNQVDTWQWTVVGTTCTMYSMSPGWLDLTVAAATVRQYAQTQLTVHPQTGSVLVQGP